MRAIDERGRARKRRFHRGRFAAALGVVCGLSALAPSPADALSIGGGSEVGDLGDPNVLVLDSSDYSIANFRVTANASFTGAPGDVLTFSSTLTVTPPQSHASAFQGALVVITSVRVGTHSQCTPGGFAGRHPITFDPLGVTGGTGLLVSDPKGPGTLCDLEDTVNGTVVPFGTVGIAATSIANHAFSFKMVVDEQLSLSSGIQFVVFSRTFALVPEPATLALLGCGLATLAALRRFWPDYSR